MLENVLISINPDACYCGFDDCRYGVWYAQRRINQSEQLLFAAIEKFIEGQQIKERHFEQSLFLLSVSDIKVVPPSSRFKPFARSFSTMPLQMAGPNLCLMT